MNGLTARNVFEAAVRWAKGTARNAGLKVVHGRPGYNPLTATLALPRPHSAEGVSPDTADEATVLYRMFVGHEVHGHARNTRHSLLEQQLPKVVLFVWNPIEDGFIERKAIASYPGLAGMFDEGYRAACSIEELQGLQGPQGGEGLLRCLHGFLWTHARRVGTGLTWLGQVRDQWFEALSSHLSDQTAHYVWSEATFVISEGNTSLATMAGARRILAAIYDEHCGDDESDSSDPSDSSGSSDASQSAGSGSGTEQSDAADDSSSAADSSTDEGDDDSGGSDASDASKSAGSDSGTEQSDAADGSSSANRSSANEAGDDGGDGSGSGRQISDEEADELAGQLDPQQCGTERGANAEDELADAIAAALGQAVDEVDRESRQAVAQGQAEDGAQDGAQGSGSGAGPGPEDGREFPRPRLDPEQGGELQHRLGEGMRKYKSQLVQALQAEECVRTLATGGSRIDPRRAARMRIGEQRIYRTRRPRPKQRPTLSLLLDVSASVRGPLLESLSAVTYTAAQVAKEVGISSEFAIFGSNFARNRGGVSFIKYFHEPGHVALHRLPGIREYAGGGTPLAEAMGITVPRLAQMPAKHRLQLIFTDGMPDDREGVVRQIRSCHNQGITVVGFGYGEGKQAVERLGMHAVPCDSPEEFGRALMRHLTMSGRE